MSRLFTLLLNQTGGEPPVDLKLRYYPFTNSLEDSKGGEPAIFERASSKLAYDASVRHFINYAIDAPAFVEYFSRGISIEPQEINYLPYNQRLHAGTWRTEHANNTRARVANLANPGADTYAWTIQSLYDQYTRADRGASLSLPVADLYQRAFFKRAEGNEEVLVGFYTYSASNRRFVEFDSAGDATYWGSGSIPVTYSEGEASTYTLANGDEWFEAKAKLRYTSSGTRTPGFTIHQGASTAGMYIWMPVIQQYKNSSPIPNDTATAVTRAQDSLVIPNIGKLEGKTMFFSVCLFEDITFDVTGSILLTMNDFQLRATQSGTRTTIALAFRGKLISVTEGAIGSMVWNIWKQMNIMINFKADAVRLGFTSPFTAIVYSDWEPVDVATYTALNAYVGSDGVTTKMLGSVADFKIINGGELSMAEAAIA